MSNEYLAPFYAKLEADIERIESFTLIEYPVYILSRGRAATITTSRLFDDAGVPYLIVVEPQEHAAYLEHHDAGNLLVMDKNDEGIAYVRNYIRDHAQAAGFLYFWQFDDDLRPFGVRRGGKRYKLSARNALAFVEYVVDHFDNIGGANFSHHAFAFTYDHKPVIQLNNQIYGAMLIRSGTRTRFRKDINEDTDHSLQLLREGWVTFVFKRVVMDTVATMSNSGGNTDNEYAAGRREARVRALCAAWPSAKFRAVNRNGRWTMTPSRIWGKFEQRPYFK